MRVYRFIEFVGFVANVLVEVARSQRHYQTKPNIRLRGYKGIGVVHEVLVFPLREVTRFFKSRNDLR